MSLNIRAATTRDGDAPTGGYLLTACFASEHVAGQGALNYLAGQI